MGQSDIVAPVSESGCSANELSEDDVKRTLQDWLQAAAWQVKVMWAKKRGIDIEAERGGQRWLIEAKGCGSLDPMRVNYFLAILGELLQRMDDPNARYSIAFPDLKQYRGLWRRLPGLAKERTGITALFVAPDGVVSEDPVRTSETPMDIRLLTAADATAFWHLRLEALQEEPEAFSVSADEHRSTTIADASARLGGDPANTFVVGAFVDGELVGTAGFRRESRAKLHHKGRVWGMYVTARVRRTGIGRALLLFLLAHAARVEGIEQIELSVGTTQTAAVALYQSLGFRSFGMERRALKIGDQYFDQEHMVLEVGAGGDLRP